jgi:hypothetical protein
MFHFFIGARFFFLLAQSESPLFVELSSDAHAGKQRAKER